MSLMKLYIWVLSCAFIGLSSLPGHLHSGDTGLESEGGDGGRMARLSFQLWSLSPTLLYICQPHSKCPSYTQDWPLHPQTSLNGSDNSLTLNRTLVSNTGSRGEIFLENNFSLTFCIIFTWPTSATRERTEYLKQHKQTNNSLNVAFLFCYSLNGRAC